MLSVIGEKYKIKKVNDIYHVRITPLTSEPEQEREFEQLISVYNHMLLSWDQCYKYPESIECEGLEPVEEDCLDLLGRNLKSLARMRQVMDNSEKVVKRIKST